MTSDEMSRRVRELNAMDLAIAEHEQRKPEQQERLREAPCPVCGSMHYCAKKEK